MNNPLRYSGYIFYQSSYIEDIDGVSSILAVVQNNNYFMPYISSMLMSLGLIVYIFTLLQNKLNKK
jgi:ABC-type phosphate transport system permease subunit